MSKKEFQINIICLIFFNMFSKKNSIQFFINFYFFYLFSNFLKRFYLYPTWSMSELRNRKPQSDTDEEKYNSEEEFDDSSNWKQYSEKESMEPLSHVLCTPNPSRNPLDTQSQKSDLWPRIKSALILAISFIFICYQGLRPTVLLVNVLQVSLLNSLFNSIISNSYSSVCSRNSWMFVTCLPSRNRFPTSELSIGIPSIPSFYPIH